jgi:hypothetical protein
MLTRVMRIMVTLVDDLLRIAEHFAGVSDKATLIREALKVLIERESTRRWPLWAAACLS